jgi:integrase
VLHQIVESSRRLKPSSKQTYIRDLNKWVRFAGGDPTAWTWQLATSFYEDMLDSMEPQSANRVMHTLIYAVKQRAKLEQNPQLDFVSNIELVRASSPKAAQRALTQEEVERLLSTCRGSTKPADLRDYALMVVALETGMRRMSLQGFERQNIARDAKLGHLVATVPIKQHGPYPVPLSPTAVLALTPWLTWLEMKGISTGPIFRGLPKARIGDLSPISDHALTTTAIYQIVAHRGEQAHVADLHPHTFRHTFVTWRRAAGMADHEIAAVTGHTVDSEGKAKMLSNYTDVGVAGKAAVKYTPPWLTKFVRSQ